MGESLPALRSVPGLRATRALARSIAALLIAVVAILAFIPWQQNIRGAGRVVALDPYDRLQTIAAPVMGRVHKAWVVEGSRVTEGDPLVEIVDNDPAIVERLAQQRVSLAAALEASRAKATVYEEQARALTEARALAISAAEQHIEVAQAKVRSEQQRLGAARAVERPSLAQLQPPA